jgi:hypothetical protein
MATLIKSITIEPKSNQFHNNDDLFTPYMIVVENGIAHEEPITQEELDDVHRLRDLYNSQMNSRVPTPRSHALLPPISFSPKKLLIHSPSKAEEKTREKADSAAATVLQIAERKEKKVIAKTGEKKQIESHSSPMTEKHSPINVSQAEKAKKLASKAKKKEVKA